jgi:hypothetical protein
MAAPLHATLDNARQAPIPAGFRSGARALGDNAPAGNAPQTPLGQDESVSGRGTWVAFCGPKGGKNG